MRSAHPARHGRAAALIRNDSLEGAGDLSSKGALARIEVNQSRLSGETRQSGGQGSLGPSSKVKYVNLQALIDREIIMDQML